MNLAIISDCIHTYGKDNKVGSNVNILVKQIDALTQEYDEILLICPFDMSISSNNLAYYSNDKIKFYPLENVGGNLLKDKLNIVKQIPKWIKSYKAAYQFGDIIYLRFPNNLNILAIFYFFVFRKKTFASYTGTWDKNYTESITYTFQKFLLKYIFKGPVGVYSKFKINDKSIFNSFSPSYTESEWLFEEENVKIKIKNINNNSKEIILLTVGSLIEYKNQQYVLNTCLKLKENNISFHLYVIGDGKLKNNYNEFIISSNLSDDITLLGEISSNELKDYYRKADFVIQSPLIEGFGKVPIESYFYGVIPIISDISLSAEITKNGELGYLFDLQDSNAVYDILIKILKDKKVLKNRIIESRKFVKNYTIEKWLNEYTVRINKYFNT